MTMKQNPEDFLGKPTKEKKSVQFWIDKDLKERMEAECEARKVSMNRFVIAALEYYLSHLDKQG